MNASPPTMGSRPAPTVAPPPAPPAPGPSAQGHPGRARAGVSARSWRISALLSAGFTLLVALLMAVDYQRTLADDPLNAPELQALREQLHAKPRDEALLRQIREADLRARRRYFTRVQRNSLGAFLLLGGATASVIGWTRFFALRRKMPGPRPLASWSDLDRSSRQAMVAVMATAGVLFAGIVAVSLQRPGAVPSAAGTKQTPAGSSAASLAELPATWPRFRGADGSGVSGFSNVPLAWNIVTRENVAWISRVPLAGHSSPVVVGEHVFLTGAEKTARELFCFDARGGSLRWRLPVTLVTAEAVRKMDLPELTGAAAATVAADGQRVYAIFGTGELIAADHSGRLVWSKSFGKPENPYGHATSLVVWRNQLLVQLDQGEPEAARSRLYSFDSATGNLTWQARRSLPSSWGTPLVVQVAGADQIVCLGEPWLIGYALEDGRELWRFEGLGSDLTPSPMFAAGLLFVINPHQQLYAIRPDGRGDVTRTHLAWKVEENVPDITSPVSNGQLVFLMETHGTLVCLEAKTGRKLWEHAFDTEFNASPALSGDRLLVVSLEGEAIAVKAGPVFEELSRSSLGEFVKASPAFADGRMFVRGATNLFCIAATAAAGGDR